MRPLIALVLLASAAQAKGPTKKLVVQSPVVKDGGELPAEYTCDGSSTSPPLQWSGIPGTTRSIAVLVEDHDAAEQPFVNWLVTNIGSTTGGLLEGSTPAGAMIGRNDNGTNGYVAPCPTSKHHYMFRVFALDTAIPRPASRAEFLAAIRGHVIVEGELVATYER